MDEQASFELTLEGRVVVIRCFGTWEVADSLAFREALATFVVPLHDGEPWSTLVDFTHWAPATPEVAELANGARDIVDNAGRTSGAYLFGSLGVAEKLIEKGVIDPASRRVQYFHSEAEARAWLRTLGHLPSES